MAEHPVRRKRLPDTRGRILAAATALFAAKGFHGTTTRDIAAATDLSPGAVYVHFESKEEILFHIITHGHSAIIELLHEAHDNNPTPLEQVYAGVRLFAHDQVAQHARARVVHFELAALAPDRIEVVREQRREITRIMGEVIASGAADGSFAVSDLEMSVLAVQGITIDIARWYGLDSDGTADDISANYADLALRILGVTDERRKAVEARA